MGKIYYLIGKSSTGKDTIKDMLLRDSSLGLSEIVQYTTRPIRDGETEGREYHFITESEAEALKQAGRIVEQRAYQTVHGIWRYMFVNSNELDLKTKDYLVVGTVEAYQHVRDFYGEAAVIPLYVYVETGERLQRALNRERNHANPKYAEMCRRFLTDEADFSDEKLKEAGLIMTDGSQRNFFENIDLEECVSQIRDFIDHDRRIS